MLVKLAASCGAGSLAPAAAAIVARSGATPAQVTRISSPDDHFFSSTGPSLSLGGSAALGQSLQMFLTQSGPNDKSRASIGCQKKAHVLAPLERSTGEGPPVRWRAFFVSLPAMAQPDAPAAHPHIGPSKSRSHAEWPGLDSIFESQARRPDLRRQEMAGLAVNIK